MTFGQTNPPLDKLREITAKNVANGGAIYEQRQVVPAKQVKEYAAFRRDQRGHTWPRRDCNP